MYSVGIYDVIRYADHPLRGQPFARPGDYLYCFSAAYPLYLKLLPGAVL